MMVRTIGAVLARPLIALVISATPALADAIDGEWCSKDGKHLSIEGSRIVTPAGTASTGAYDRHAFTYTIPDTDPGAGNTVFMTLVDDRTVHLTNGSEADKPAEIWLRCEVMS